MTSLFFYVVGMDTRPRGVHWIRGRGEAVPGTVSVNAEELAACLAAIRNRHPDAAVLRVKQPWVDIVADTPQGRMIYVTAQEPARLEIGSIYVTWVVEIASDGARRVAFFRSRKGEDGDDTLPP
jgi:hypothetical protein